MSSRQVSALLVAATAGLLCAGCHSTSSRADKAGLVVVSSTDVWGDVAATIAGNDAVVTSFLDSPSQGPHSFQPSARDVLAVSDADVVVENGGGYDDFMDQLVDSADTDATVIDAVDISGLDDSASDTFNEHIWYDVGTVEKVADTLAKAFGKADPTHTQRYLDNATAFTSSLDILQGQEAAMKRSFGGVRVGITEPVPDYMLASIGAVNATPEAFSSAVEEGQEVSVSVLQQTLALYSDHAVAALVYNEQTAGPLTDQVEQAAKQAGVPVVGVTETLPSGDSYVDWMRDNLDHLDQALSQ